MDGIGPYQWLGLTDTAPTFAGQATKFPKVNAGETALEFAAGAHLIALLEALSAQGWNQQFSNLIKNSSFESWSGGVAAAPDGWSISGITIARDADEKIGDYAAKMTFIAGAGYLIHTLAEFAYYQGRTVTFGVWIKTSTASLARILIADGVGTTYSSFHTGGGSYEFLTVTRTIAGAAIKVETDVEIAVAGNCLCDAAILVEGTIAPTFAPAPVEHVVGWQNWVPTLTGGADLSGYTVARFCRIGNLCFFRFCAENKNVTTAGNIQITLPYTHAATVGFAIVSMNVHNGTAWQGQVKNQIAANTNYLEVWETLAGDSWGGAETGVYIRASGFYEVA